jgi:hypothetical protein
MLYLYIPSKSNKEQLNPEPSEKQVYQCAGDIKCHPSSKVQTSCRAKRPARQFLVE